MIKHIVLLRFRADIDEARKQDIYDALRALVGRIEGLLGGSFGRNVSPEGLHQGFLDGFSMDFADAAARDRYLVDPDHKAAGARLVGALEGGVAGLIVFDIEI